MHLDRGRWTSTKKGQDNLHAVRSPGEMVAGRGWTYIGVIVDKAQDWGTQAYKLSRSILPEPGHEHIATPQAKRKLIVLSYGRRSRALWNV